MTFEEEITTRREPRVPDSAWVAPSADVVGDVELAEEVSVWYQCVLRGDIAPIRVGRETNIQDLTMVHVDVDQPCVIDRFEVGALAGGYLRRTGLERLLRDVHGARYHPLPGLSQQGRVPAPRALPTTGTTRYTGRATLDAQLTGEDGTVSEIAASGAATLSVGWGSGQARLSLSNLAPRDGAAPALPFVTLDWARLGLCGARIVSTGQGTFRTIDAEERRVRPLAGPDGDGPPARAIVESAVFAGADPAALPATAAGVFLIQGDGGALRGAFTARSP